MKINIISDIHAVYDPATDKVMYNLEPKYSSRRYLTASTRLLEYWKDNLAELEKTEFKPSPLQQAFPETFVVKTHEDAVNWLAEFNAAARDGFKSLDKEKAYMFYRALTCIGDHCWKNHINWNSRAKTKISVGVLGQWMYKHLYDFHPEKLEPADYLIIAGDLGLDCTYDKILDDITKRTAGKFKKILHIAGNHDHWWIKSQSDSNTRPTEVNLSRDYCEHHDGDYAFLGCTMWTPISDNAIWRIGRGMNDYNYTPGNFSPYVSRHQYEVQTSWLRSKLGQNKDKKVIVFTHHQPFDELICDDYKHSDVNEAYVVTDHSLDDINEHGNIKLWCCGHTHQNFDGMLHGIHVVRNPIGYGDLYGQIPAENPSGTWYNKIIEL